MNVLPARTAPRAIPERSRGVVATLYDGTGIMMLRFSCHEAMSVPALHIRTQLAPASSNRGTAPHAMATPLSCKQHRAEGNGGIL